MLTRDLPNYEENIKPGNFKVPIEYSSEIVQLMSSLLKKKPAMRPEVKELFSTDIVLMAVEKL